MPSPTHTPVISKTSSRAEQLAPAIDVVWLSILILAGAALRFLHLADKSFWFDEGVSVAIARLHWYDFFRILSRHEANMTLYYLALRPWLLLGHTEAFVRAFSVLFGLAAIPALYWLGKELCDRKAGLMAAALLTFNAFHVRYSQEARSYALFLLFSILSSYFFLRSSTNPSQQNRRWHIITSVLAMYAHFFAALLLATQWLWARVHRDFRPRFGKNWRWIAVLSAPLLLFIVTTGAGPLAWIPRPGWRDLYDFCEMIAGHGGLILCVLTFALVVAAACVSLRRHEDVSAIFLLAWFLGPIIFLFAISQVRSFFLPRYLIFVLPAFLLLVAHGIQVLPSTRLRGLVFAVLLSLSWLGVSAYYQKDFDIEREDWRDASRYVLWHAEPGDALVFHVLMGRMPYEFYRSNDVGPLVVAPRHADYITYKDFLGRPDRALLESLPAHYGRVWVVLSHNERKLGEGADDTTRMIQDVLGGAYPRQESHRWLGVEVRLYERDARE